MTTLTRAQLVAGALVAPVFYGVFAILALVTPGFHLEKHAISALSLGDLGWEQRSNFLVSGVLALAGGLGLAQSWRGERGGVAAPVLVGILGLGLVVSGLFSSDPAMGFPPGTPEGLPATFSTSALVHSLGFYSAFTALTAAAFVVAARERRHRRPGAAWSSLGVGIATPGLIALGMTVASSVAGVAFAAAGLVSLGWLGLVFLGARSSLKGE